MSDIHIYGAKQNNLKDIDVTIPKHQITVFTGRSGSGKSSLVFNTIAAESERLLNETYSSYIQSQLNNILKLFSSPYLLVVKIVSEGGQI